MRFMGRARIWTIWRRMTSDGFWRIRVSAVEPGIYLPEFGVRSEIDMLTAPGKAWVTGMMQRELVRI